MGDLLYLYCFTSTDNRGPWDTEPMPRCGPPETVVVGGALAAVVAETDQKKFSIARQFTTAHLRINEAVREEGTVLPVRFGTVAEGRREIERLLQQERVQLESWLDEMNGMWEFGLRVTMPKERMIALTVASDKPLQRAREQLQEGNVSHEDRLRIGERVEKVWEALRDKYAGSVLEVIEDQVMTQEIKEPVSDNMILNAVFLRKDRQWDDIAELLAPFEERWGEDVVFRVVGPAPPFHFVNLRIEWNKGISR